VEIYAVAVDPGPAARQITDLVDAAAPAPVGLLGAAAGGYVRHGLDAVEHLCRVACGLDSVIVGEAEISGQIRRAASRARDAGVLGPYLEAVVAGALACSGRARAETAIARGVTSVASAGVTLGVSLLGTLAHRTVLVVGAGQAGRQALARLGRLETGRLLIASRSEHHAHEAAALSGAEAVDWDRMPALVDETDLLIAAVQAPRPVVDASRWGPRIERPLVAIDLSVPRAIDPRAADVPGVTLRTVDDLGDIARESLARRAREIPLVEAIVAEEAFRAFRRLSARAARR
jgi:glutamyl-tRNA reductase